MTETETSYPASPAPPLDPAAEIAPLRRATGRPSKDGQVKFYPDLFNHLPKRMVSQAEAKTQGWVFFYEGEECRYGHIAPRYTSNPRMCVDCIRAQRNLRPIGMQQGGAPRRGPKPARRAPKAALKKQDKQFLEKLAELRSFEQAAEAVGLSLATALANIASKPALAKAVADIEKRLGLKGVPTTGEPSAAPATFEWSDAKRAQLIETWIDTGDIAQARDAIGVRPSEFMREIDRNEEFAAAVKAAEPQATRMLEERAYQLALKGNDKLLTKILSAKNADYRETVKLDVNQKTTHTLDSATLDARLRLLLAKHGGDFIDAIRIGEAGAVRTVGGEATALLPQPDSNILSGQGTVQTGALPATFEVLRSGEDS